MATWDWYRGCNFWKPSLGEDAHKGCAFRNYLKVEGKRGEACAPVQRPSGAIISGRSDGFSAAEYDGKLATAARKPPLRIRHRHHNFWFDQEDNSLRARYDRILSGHDLPLSVAL